MSSGHVGRWIVTRVVSYSGRYLHGYCANVGRVKVALERCVATCKSVCEDEGLKLV